MDKIIKKYCSTCADYKDCPYRLRNLQSKCPQLYDVAYGYELAEQDLALTWKDVKIICEIEECLWEEESQKTLNRQKTNNTEEHYKEVLKRFNEQRK